MRVSDLTWKTHSGYWSRAEVLLSNELKLGIYRNDGYEHHPEAKPGEYIVIWSVDGYDNGKSNAWRLGHVDTLTLGCILADPLALRPARKTWRA